MTKNDDPKGVWVKNRTTGTVFMAGAAQVAELGDDYDTVVGPDDHTVVGTKTKVKAAQKAQEAALEDGTDGQGDDS